SHTPHCPSHHTVPHSFPTRRSSDLNTAGSGSCGPGTRCAVSEDGPATDGDNGFPDQIPNDSSGQISSFQRPSASRGASLQSIPRSADGFRIGDGESVNPVPPSLRRAKET